MGGFDEEKRPAGCEDFEFNAEGAERLCGQPDDRRLRQLPDFQRGSRGEGMETPRLFREERFC
ncbi:hypothetical protein D3C78_1894920 [compost metagenome]